MTSLRRAGGPASAAILLVALLAACGGAPPAPQGNAAQEPAVLQAGDLTVRASAVPSSLLGEAAARQYGVERDPRNVLLVVGLRRGQGDAEASLPARVDARATDLLGRGQPLALREVRSDGFIDYVGVARISPPETVRFDVRVEADGAAPLELRFSRDFFR